jgi:outer membrane lipoprotein-sorting protein
MTTPAHRTFIILTILVCFTFALNTGSHLNAGKVLPLNGSPVYAGEMTYEQILDKSTKVNAGLESFKAKLRIKVHFMGLSLPMKGFLYYKKPDKLRLMITSVPAILKNRKNLFQEMIPRSFNSKDYKGRIVREEKIEGTVKCLLLELIPRKAGKITKVQLWVDKESLLIPKSKVFYSDEAVITSLQSYRIENKFALPDKQKVDFEFPNFRASGLVEYISYELNVPVDEYINKPLEK